VDTIVEFRCIRRVSQKRFHDSTSRFPPLAPTGCCSPASSVLSRRYDFLPLIPPHFVSFAWRYLGRTRLSSLPGGRVRRQGLELLTRCLQPGRCRGNDRSSQVPGESQLSVCTCSSDAGRTACTRPWRCSSVALGFCNAKAPTKGLSALNSTAFGLAVYASQDGSPRHHARLASGCWSGSTGRASHPQDSVERFHICFLTSNPPFPSLAWRKHFVLSELAVGDAECQKACARA
jgi:hypothetical protein